MPWKAIPVLLIAAATVGADVVNDVLQALNRNDFPLAEATIAKYRTSSGVTPDLLHALSWLGRAALQTNQLDRADAYAKETQRLAAELLKRRPLDAERNLPTAVGAAIEVRGQVLNRRGNRAEALAFLQSQLTDYRATSIAARIQKNINLLALEGKPAPVLEMRESVGAKPVSLLSLKGKPVLLFFWAHWCADCKAQQAILGQVAKEYAAKGLVFVAPTQRYGYVARGAEAGPAEEFKYIAEMSRQYLDGLPPTSAPVSEANFNKYGASTVPTLVLIDRQGIVRLYHPGVMTLAELRAALNRIG